MQFTCRWILVGLLHIWFIANATPRVACAEESPPNILFVISDDWGVHAGAYGTPWINTPAFDRVAKEGLL
ncbi:MAG: heparan N-sulfatase, partial [Pirellula sp.]